MSRQDLLLSYYENMLAALGPSKWWPGRTPMEIALGAILTQHTAWTNVEKALHNLDTRGLLNAHALDAVAEQELAELIRPAGYFQIKASRIRHFLDFLRESCDLEIERLRDQKMNDLREALLRVKGIGPETADGILLYALDFPSFVVDAYTLRIFNRHLLIPEETSYDELRNFFMDVLPADTRLFNEYHALIVRTGKTWCAKTKEKCQECPLFSQLPS